MESVRYSVFIRNRLPNRSLDMQSPISIFHKNSTNKYTHSYKVCKPFGCTAYAFVYKGERRNVVD